jgi:pyrrolidone-carboxylate peptidase
MDCCFLPSQGVRVDRSDFAGGMYCEYLLYESLAALYRRGEAARVVFLHHPGEKSDEAGTKEGAAVAVSVIGAMIDQLNSE